MNINIKNGILSFFVLVISLVLFFAKRLFRVKNYYAGLVTILFPFVGQWIGREFLIKKKKKKNKNSWVYIMMPIPGLHIIPGLMMWKGLIG